MSTHINGIRCTAAVPDLVADPVFPPTILIPLAVRRDWPTIDDPTSRRPSNSPSTDVPSTDLRGMGSPDTDRPGTDRPSTDRPGADGPSGTTQAPVASTVASPVGSTVPGLPFGLRYAVPLARTVLVDTAGVGYDPVQQVSVDGSGVPAYATPTTGWTAVQAPDGYPSTDTDPRFAEERP